MSRTISPHSISWTNRASRQEFPIRKRRGGGTALIGKLESNLAARGVRSILLETAIDNEAAVAFWQRHGYRIEAVLKRYYLGRLDAYEMRKILPPARKAGMASGEKF